MSALADFVLQNTWAQYVSIPVFMIGSYLLMKIGSNEE